MPIQGFTRFRKHQLGKQSVIGTAVAATEVWPFRGNIVADPHWTDPDVDVGSIDPVLPPFRTSIDVTASETGPLTFNSVPVIMAAGVRGGVAATGGGTAKTWDYTALSLTATTLDMFTDEWGDDVTTDWVQAFGGIISRVQMGFGPELGPWEASMDWMYAGRNTPVGPTASLSVGSNPIWMYGADTEVYINDSFATLGTSKLSDQVHSVQVTITNTMDAKRFANGSNTRFQTMGWGLAGREIMTEIVLAKSTEAIAETARWLANDAANRFLEIRTTSPTLAQASIPHSNSIKQRGYWMTRTDAEQGGNDTIVLTLRQNYATDIAYAFKDTVVCTRTALP